MLVALFLVAGSLASALSASDEQWWQQHFSALGAASDRSGILFNFTLILTGVVLTALADFLTHDLQLWAEHHGERHWKVTFVRVGLIALGFPAVTAAVVALIAGVVWLHLGVGYLNITAFEMGAVSTVFVWLVLLIRTVTAAVSEIPETSPAEVEVAAP